MLAGPVQAGLDPCPWAGATLDVLVRDDDHPAFEASKSTSSTHCLEAGTGRGVCGGGEGVLRTPRPPDASAACSHGPRIVLVEDGDVGTALIAELRKAGINAAFQAVVDTTEEVILNAMPAAKKA